MANKVVVKFPAKRFKKYWNPLFKDGTNWLFGYFKPTARSSGEVTYLENHQHPELFMLVKGSIMLMLKKSERSAISKLKLKEGEAVIINCWHNGYALERGSAALIIERPVNPTKKMMIVDPKNL